MISTTLPSSSAYNPQLLHPHFRLLYLSRQSINFPRYSIAFYSWRNTTGQAATSRALTAVNGEKTRFTASAWDEKPFEELPNGKKLYLDELDIVTFLDPPKELIPLEPKSYHPAAYLWKKIEDVPEERRHRLLYLLNNRQISAAWEISGARYDDAKLAERCSSSLLCSRNNALATEVWYCRKNGGTPPFSLVNYFKKALFHKDGEMYGRLIGTQIAWKWLNALQICFHETETVLWRMDIWYRRSYDMIQWLNNTENYLESSLDASDSKTVFFLGKESSFYFIHNLCLKQYPILKQVVVCALAGQHAFLISRTS